MNKAQCPECGCTKLIVSIPLAYHFEDGEVGSIACDGPEENLTMQCVTICDKCELVASFGDFETAAKAYDLLEETLRASRKPKKES